MTRQVMIIDPFDGEELSRKQYKYKHKLRLARKENEKLQSKLCEMETELRSYRKVIAELASNPDMKALMSSLICGEAPPDSA